MAEEKSTGDRLAPILVVLLVIAAFLIGTMWTRVGNLEKKLVTNNNVGTAPTSQPAIKESPLSVSSLKVYAKELGLDTNKFNSCVDSKKFAGAVSSDISFGSSVGVQGTPAFFINGKFLSGAQPFEIFKEIIDKELDGTGSDDASAYSQKLQDYASTPKEQGGPYFIAKKRDIQIGSNDPIRGAKDAKVTVVVFSDFECPYCVRAYPTIKQIEDTYKDNVRVVFKQFPLTQIHQYAQGAAEATLCANEQGKFWEFHDKVFSVPRT